MSDRFRNFTECWERVYINRIAQPVGLAFFLFGTTLAMVEVFRRYVFRVSFMWQQDIVVVSVVSGICLYLAVAQWDRSHIAVTVVQEFLARKKTPGRLRAIQIVNAVGEVWTGVFLVLILIWGAPMVIEYHRLGIRLTSHVMAFWPFFLVFVVSLVPLAVTFAMQAYGNICRAEISRRDAEEAAK